MTLPFTLVSERAFEQHALKHWASVGTESYEMASKLSTSCNAQHEPQCPARATISCIAQFTPENAGMLSIFGLFQLRARRLRHSTALSGQVLNSICIR